MFQSNMYLHEVDNSMVYKQKFVPTNRYLTKIFLFINKIHQQTTGMTNIEIIDSEQNRIFSFVIDNSRFLQTNKNTLIQLPLEVSLSLNLNEQYTFKVWSNTPKGRGLHIQIDDNGKMPLSFTYEDLSEAVETTRNKEKECISVIIPTLFKVDRNFFKQMIAECLTSEYVGEIIIIDNTKTNEGKMERFLLSNKIRLINHSENLYVNRAWNYGVALAKYPYVAVLNDDVICKNYMFGMIANKMKDTKVGIITCNTLGGDRPEIKDNKIQSANDYILKLETMEKIKPKFECAAKDIHKGWFYVMRKTDWTYIPHQLKIWCGDNLIYNIARRRKKKILKMTSHFIYHYHKGSVTSSQLNNRKEFDEEVKYWEKIDKTFPPKKPTLSLLICTLDERAMFLRKLLEMLKPQCTGDVEIIVDCDNRQKTIGKKRNDLMKKAKGEYIAYIDDDDVISDDYVAEILYAINKSNPDAVGFKSKISFDGLRESTTIMSHEHGWTDEQDPAHTDRRIYYRPIQHLNPVKRKLALKVQFPDIGFEEDKRYAVGLKEIIKTEEFIDKFLYYYLFVTIKKRDHYGKK